ncbi:ferredoxin reductase [Microbacterium sp.]|uniref:ferredoxin reductase n=1 Tax=Microbacterium sp. TaxID=51671 RepID=UPI003F9A9BEC
MARKEAVSDRAVLLELLAADDALLEPFTPGAHIDLHIDPGVVRQYSLDDVDRSAGAYVICVQREPAGRGGSIAVHDSIREGDTVQISLPRNTFGMVESAGHVVLLAAGVGVTTLVSMAAHLHRSGADFEFHAYAHSARALALQCHRRHRAPRPARTR